MLSWYLLYLERNYVQPEVRTLLQADCVPSKSHIEAQSYNASECD